MTKRKRAEGQPGKLSAPEALKLVRLLATDSENIVPLDHARHRMRQRHGTLLQVVNCLRKGTIVEGPFVNNHGLWQVTIYRHAADEKLKCAVAIQWKEKLLVVTVMPVR